MADVKENKNPQGFYFNQQACIGCRTCQVACKDKNDLEVGYLFRRVESFEVGEFPKPATFHYSGCLQPLPYPGLRGSVPCRCYLYQ